MLYSHFVWIFSVWLSSFVIGIISWPFAQLFFSRLSDKGYSVAKIIGWIVITYVLFVLSSAKIISFSKLSLVVIVIAWFLINLFLEFKHKNVSKNFHLRQILLIELFFIFLISFMVFVKGHQPELQSIERFPNFSLVQSLFNADSLPLFDRWFLGESVNYYYFAYIVAYSILALSSIPVIPGFFIVVAWLFGLLGVNVYRLGKDFFSLLQEHKTLLIISGIVSFFEVLLAGTLYSLYVFYPQLRFLLNKSNAAVNFFFPEPTRVIAGEITEMPVYGFIVHDVHPHMFGLLSGVIVLSILYVWWRDEQLLNLKNKFLWLLSFFLGIAYMMHSWDAITLGLLSMLVLFIKFRGRDLLLYFLIPVVAYAVALPWSLFFSAPISGVGWVGGWPSLLQWFSFWGVFVLLILFFLAKIFVLKQKYDSFYLILISASLFFILFIELFYFKDILQNGDWFRANTTWKISSQVWLWLGIISGPLIVWMVATTKKYKPFLFFFLAFIILVQAIYPVKAFWQANFENKKFTGLDSALDWWKTKYSYDYEAYEYLSSIRDSIALNDKTRNIVEAEGDSYTDVSRFSVFLGWPVIIGWPIHEWTWRGSYEPVGARRSEVSEIYNGANISTAKTILSKYKIDYIIVGQVEKSRYNASIKLDKLKKLGKVVFNNGETFVVRVK